MSKTYMMDYIIQNSQYLNQEDKNDIVKIVKDNTEDAAIMEQNKKRKNDVDINLDIMLTHNVKKIYEVMKSRMDYLNNPSMY